MIGRFNIPFALFATAVTLSAGAVSASAADVRLKLSAQETQVGVPVVLQVVIEGADDGRPPSLPEVDGLRFRSSGGPNQVVSYQNINGVTQSSKTLTYQYELTPMREGRFTVPSFEVAAGGTVHKTQPFTLVVNKSETTDLLFVEIKGDRNKLYVGESLKLTLQIWLRPYADRNYRLNAETMWSLVSDQSMWGSFRESLEELARQRMQPRQREVLRKDTQNQDRRCFLYEIDRTVRVGRPGQLSAEDINIVVTYPTGLARSNDIFSMGSLRMTGAVPISGQAKVAPIEVLPIPEEGRPAWYSGAVGEYTIATTAKPTDVAVGDPITLTMTIKGTGGLDELQPPPVAELSELAADFRVPNDPLAGEVTPDGKRFSVSIRAASDQVTAIPPIPFAFFDPQQEKFVTVRSEPIPLNVKPAEKLAISQIVDAGGSRAAAPERLTEATGGILANYTGMDEVLTQQELTWGVSTMAAIALPPLAFAAAWIGRRRTERLRTDVGFARGRRARRNAVSRIGKADGNSSKETAAAVGSAISQYVADRCNLPSGGMTRAAVIETLGGRSVNAGLIGEVNSLLEECESIHYAGAGSRTAAELREAALRCIDRLERERMA